MVHDLEQKAMKCNFAGGRKEKESKKKKGLQFSVLKQEVELITYKLTALCRIT